MTSPGERRLGPGERRFGPCARATLACFLAYFVMSRMLASIGIIMPPLRVALGTVGTAVSAAVTGAIAEVCDTYTVLQFGSLCYAILTVLVLVAWARSAGPPGSGRRTAP